MDTIRGKRRAFSKSKLMMSFHRATKPSSAALQPHTNKPPKPPSSSNSSPTSLEFVANQPIRTKVSPAGSPMGFLIVNQDQVFPQQPSKVAFVVTDNKHGSYGKLENFYGGAPENEAVDEEADRYISSVQERFRLDSERKNFDDVNL